MKNVILYSSITNLQKAINNNQYHVIECFNQQNKLKIFCHDTLETIDILFFVEENNGNGIEFLLEFRESFPSIRIIYISPDVDLTNVSVVEKMCLLIDKGIYDIFFGERIDKKTIQSLLSNPKTREDNSTLLVLRRRNKESIFDKRENEVKQIVSDTANEETDSKHNEDDMFEIINESEDLSEGHITRGYDNVIVVSSIKPGTGKSFVSTNLAANIAKFGKRRFNGEVPKVAIIEGDLQTLAVGTLLKISNEKYNLRNALSAIAKIMDNDGNLFGSDEEQAAVKEFILKCFLPFSEIQNLFVLSASQVNFEDWTDINPYHYFYLVESVIEDFDVIFIDSNSALEHKTTGPILQLANVCLYVIDLEYNNIRMNLRYQQVLNELGISKKVRYILNRDISKQVAKKFAEPLEYDANSLAKDFKVLGRIPLIDSSVVLNRLKLGRPIVLDETPETIEARMEITNISDKIWDMDNILSLKLEKEIIDSKKEKDPPLVDKLFK